jgi:glucan endo-1,6-beta-glucosidase
MFLIFHILLAIASSQFGASQKIEGLGSSGGNGPKGGLGDLAHPVTSARAIITDALIPTIPGSTRQLAEGEPPVLLDVYTVKGPVKPGGGERRNEIFNVTIDTAAGPRQELLGFGHSWTDSAVEMFGSLDPDIFHQVMEDLFGQDGNNMGMMRHTIGSSDLSYDQYSYHDKEPDINDGSMDLNLPGFDLGHHGSRMADLIAKMGTYKSDVLLVGSPWSSPGWMKLNHKFITRKPNASDERYYNFANNTFNLDFIPHLAAYLAKYVDAFKEHGVTVNAITAQNEPLHSEGDGYPGMWLGAAGEANLIAQELGPLMRKHNVAIWAYDHNTNEPTYPQHVVDNGAGYVQAAAWHCYGYPVNYSVMDDFHDRNPDMLQFMTECSNYKPITGTLNFEVANAFIPPIQHWGSGACMWVMATDQGYGPHSPFGGCKFCSPSIIVHNPRSFEKTNDYYMIGQFSRFIRRGAFNHAVVEGNYGGIGTAMQFWVLAARNPDRSWAVVFMNNYYKDQHVLLKFTDNEQVWQGVIPNSTVVTWLLPPTPSEPDFINTTVSNIQQDESASDTRASSSTTSSTTQATRLSTTSVILLSYLSFGVMIGFVGLVCLSCKLKSVRGRAKEGIHLLWWRKIA